MDTSYSFDSLVLNGRVYASAVVFPATVDESGAGLSGLKFVLAQSNRAETDSDPAAQPAWVACAWGPDKLGGPPVEVLCSAVEQVLAYSASQIRLLEQTGKLLVVQPSGGCGCGSRLKTWKPGPPGTRMYGVPRPVV